MAEASSKTYALTLFAAGVQEYIGKVDSQDDNQVVFTYKKPRSSTMLRGIFAASDVVAIATRKGDQALLVRQPDAELRHYKEAKFLGWKSGFAVFEVEGEGRISVARGQFKAIAEAGKAAPKSAPAKKPAAKTADKKVAAKTTDKKATAKKSSARA